MVREKIRASVLVSVLERFGRGEEVSGYTEEMAGHRVRAALGLLAKCVPDLQRTELTGKDGAPLTVTTTPLDDEA